MGIREGLTNGTNAISKSHHPGLVAALKKRSERVVRYRCIMHFPLDAFELCQQWGQGNVAE